MLQSRILCGLLCAFFAAAVIDLGGCKSNTETTPATGAYQVTYLVSDTAAYGSNVRIDRNLVNAWGIAVGSTGSFWISAADAGVTTIYDANGGEKLPAIPIASRDSVAGGAPTGQVFNSNSSEFKGTSFIFAGEDATISAWKGGDATAKLMYKNPSANAVYKGIALLANGANDFLYVTNFKENKIEVYDNNFGFSKSFTDATIPSGYGPFGIAAIDGKLYVTYAKQLAPDNEDDEKGVGFGYVDIFNPDGTLFKRLASGGSLNSPWGIAKAPSSGFGDTFKDAILVGNFGDGKINGYDANGGFLGQLKDNNGNTLSIDGLWAILFTSAGGNDGKTLYFAAGPYDESHGVFGKIQFK